MIETDLKHAGSLHAGVVFDHEFSSSGAEVDEPMQKMALLGALSLYLDFINLFLYMLRLLGNRR